MHIAGLKEHVDEQQYLAEMCDIWGCGGAEPVDLSPWFHEQDVICDTWLEWFSHHNASPNQAFEGGAVAKLLLFLSACDRLESQFWPDLDESTFLVYFEMQSFCGSFSFQEIFVEPVGFWQ